MPTVKKVRKFMATANLKTTSMPALFGYGRDWSICQVMHGCSHVLTAHWGSYPIFYTYPLCLPQKRKTVKSILKFLTFSRRLNVHLSILRASMVTALTTAPAEGLRSIWSQQLTTLTAASAPAAADHGDRGSLRLEIPSLLVISL